MESRCCHRKPDRVVHPFDEPYSAVCGAYRQTIGYDCRRYRSKVISGKHDHLDDRRTQFGRDHGISGQNASDASTRAKNKRAGDNGDEAMFSHGFAPR